MRLSMQGIGAFCAAVAAASAMAGDLVAYEGADMVRLTAQTCDNQAVLNRLPSEVKARFLSASAVLQGRHYAACWSITPTAAYLLYEDGDEGMVPLDRLEVPVDV